MDENELERKFNEIMEKELIETPAGPPLQKISEIFPDLNEKSRNMLSRLIRDNIQTPDQLLKSAENAAHNAEIQRRRDEKLAKRAKKRK